MHSSDLVRHGLADAELPLAVREGAEIDIKYSGYLQRQQQQIDQVKRQSLRKLPADLDYASIGTLSREAREKLTAIQPTTSGPGHPHSWRQPSRSHSPAALARAAKTPIAKRVRVSPAAPTLDNFGFNKRFAVPSRLSTSTAYWNLAR